RQGRGRSGQGQRAGGGGGRRRRWVECQLCRPKGAAFMPLTIEVVLPADLARFRLPEAVDARLQTLLDRQDSGQPVTAQEREEAEGLVSLAEVLTLLRLRAERLAS